MITWSKRSFLRRHDNDRPTDRQTDMVRDKRTVVFRGYCRASPLVSSHPTVCPPISSLSEKQHTVQYTATQCSSVHSLWKCAFERQCERASRKRKREDDIVCLYLTVCVCVNVCMCLHDRQRLWPCMCVSDVKDCHCVRGETPSLFTKRFSTVRMIIWERR